MSSALPPAQGLYDPANEHDSCGVGFIVDLKGRRSHQLVRDGLTALFNLNHRGACGCENNTGDGAGILIQIPHAFLAARCRPLGITLPEPEHYGVGAFFTSPEAEAPQQFGMSLFERIVAEEGQEFLGWRRIATDSSLLGEGARVGRAGHVARLRRPRRRARRRPVRAEALRHPQAVRERDRGLGARRPQVLLFRQPVLPDPRLQGDAHHRAARALLRRRPGRSRCSRAPCACSTRGSAPTRSRAGNWPTPTG